MGRLAMHAVSQSTLRNQEMQQPMYCWPGAAHAVTVVTSVSESTSAQCADRHAALQQQWLLVIAILVTHPSQGKGARQHPTLAALGFAINRRHPRYKHSHRWSGVRQDTYLRCDAVRVASGTVCTGCDVRGGGTPADMACSVQNKSGHSTAGSRTGAPLLRARGAVMHACHVLAAHVPSLNR